MEVFQRLGNSKWANPPFFNGPLESHGPTGPLEKSRKKNTSSRRLSGPKKTTRTWDSLYFAGESILIEVQDVKGEITWKGIESVRKKTHLYVYIKYTDCLYLYIYIHVNMSLQVILLYLDSKLIKFRSPVGGHPVFPRTLVSLKDRIHRQGIGHNLFITSVQNGKKKWPSGKLTWLAGISPFPIGNRSSKDPFSISMLVYRSVFQHMRSSSCSQLWQETVRHHWW